MDAIDEDLRDDFERATVVMKSLVGEMNNSDLLYFYARYKQANNGPNCSDKPSFFNFEGKQKWNAWNNLKDMGREQAMQEYIDRVEEMEPDWRGKEMEESKGGWVSVSTMMTSYECEIAEEHKTIVDWVREGNLEKVKASDLSKEELNAMKTGTTGLGLLHWASDRGHLKVVEHLLEAAGVEIDVLDDERQTPLHYAVACDHLEVIEYLLKRGADKEIVDKDGMRAVDLCEGKEARLLFDM